MSSNIFKDAVGDSGGFGGGADVVGAEDVGSGEDGRDVGGGGGVDAAVGWWWGLVQDRAENGALGQRVAKEAFFGGPDEDGLVEMFELVEVGEERIVLVEALAEAEAGVEDDLVAGDAGGQSGFEAVCELGED
jgi:hypothetical protein